MLLHTDYKNAVKMWTPDKAPKLCSSAKKKREKRKEKKGKLPLFFPSFHSAQVTPNLHL